MRLKPYFVTALTLEGILLIALGLYFAFLRPPLLPEDIRFISSQAISLKSQSLGLSNWLNKVFVVLGGYIFSCGLLMIYISQTTFWNRTSERLLL